MKRCLIIDDVEVSRYALALFLEDLGLEAQEAESAVEAMGKLKKGRVDVIFLDWHLRRESGLDFINDLKIASDNCPIIVISGVEGQEKAAEARAAGAHAFIEKPATRQKIENALKEARIV